MMPLTPIAEYMLKSRAERRAHLDLTEPCLLICESDQNAGKPMRGILAYFLWTTIPYKQKVYVCHACNNARCGNPRHLYWGTPWDNNFDQKEAGVPSIYEKTVAKYGKEGFREIVVAAAKKAALVPRKKRGSTPLLNSGQFRVGGHKPRTWSVGSRKGIKMPRAWPRRTKAL